MGRIGKEIAHAGKYAHAMATVSVRDEATELLQGLLRANTVNPPGNETLAAELLRAYLENDPWFASGAWERAAALPAGQTRKL